MASSQKTDFNKNDMNFFSEFTTSGGQLVSSFAIVLLVFALAFIVALGSFLVLKIQMTRTQGKINELNAAINDPKTVASLEEYDQLQVSVEDHRTYLYVLNQLELKKSDELHADTSMMDTIAANIPDEIAITNLIYEDGSVTITGSCMEASASLEMAQILQELDSFYYVSIDQIETIEQSDISNLTPEELALLSRYRFKFTGSLEPYYNVTYTRVLDNAAQTPLAPSTTIELAAGDTYSIPGINSYEDDGVTYTLVRVLINGSAPSKDDMQRFGEADEITGRATTRTDIKLYYDQQEGSDE
ncbi:MAG: hypothetical protein JW780_06245 [Clostridiales bacterium]|nr:hypothetical protein [Clostridiales bacterium]